MFNLGPQLERQTLTDHIHLFAEHDNIWGREPKRKVEKEKRAPSAYNRSSRFSSFLSFLPPTSIEPIGLDNDQIGRGPSLFVLHVAV